jgi:hypothetical protein
VSPRAGFKGREREAQEAQEAQEAREGRKGGREEGRKGGREEGRKGGREEATKQTARAVAHSRRPSVERAVLDYGFLT